ncbi:MAG: hypothetical protein FWF21_02910 [Micrococcales bacterium]|nr:hypothetical protein [Micrococcales bacterium]
MSGQYSDSPQGVLPDPVVLRMATATQVAMAATGLLLFFSGIAIVSVTAEGTVADLLIGGMFLLLGLLFLGGTVAVRSRFIAIGSEGINWHVRNDRWIGWNEISAVGITWVTAPRGGPFVWIRIAGSVPGLPQRPDLDRLRIRDEPPPYTHRIQAPRPFLLSSPTTDLTAAALQRYAGPRYTGVERRFPIRRHS